MYILLHQGQGLGISNQQFSRLPVLQLKHTSGAGAGNQQSTIRNQQFSRLPILQFQFTILHFHVAEIIYPVPGIDVAASVHFLKMGVVGMTENNRVEPFFKFQHRDIAELAGHIEFFFFGKERA